MKEHCTAKNVQLPNTNGTFSARPLTPEDHQNFLKEFSLLKKHLETNTSLDGGTKLTNRHTPMLNAVYASFIKNKLDDDKRPTFVKAIVRGTSEFYGTINTKDAAQMDYVRDYIKEKA